MAWRCRIWCRSDEEVTAGPIPCSRSVHMNAATLQRAAGDVERAIAGFEVGADRTSPATQV
jgi:hypothetical protein